MNSERETGKLFSESYENVAVMFASLPKYMDFFSETEIDQEHSSCNLRKEIMTNYISA
jgi:hypothetical protein